MLLYFTSRVKLEEACFDEEVLDYIYFILIFLFSISIYFLMVFLICVLLCDIRYKCYHRFSNKTVNC